MLIPQNLFFANTNNFHIYRVGKKLSIPKNKPLKLEHAEGWENKHSFELILLEMCTSL